MYTFFATQKEQINIFFGSIHKFPTSKSKTAKTTKQNQNQNKRKEKSSFKNAIMTAVSRDSSAFAHGSSGRQC